MEHAPTFLADIAVVTAVSAVTGMLARAAGQPTILGYLLAGLIVGPSIPIPLFADPHRIESLAEFGVVLVMFAIGLEFRVSRLLRVLPLSGFTALVQVATLGWVGFSLGILLGWGTVGAAFLGAALSISSTMVVTGIFAQQPAEPDVEEHVLGVLVVQDVVAIVLIAALTALAHGQSMAASELGLLVAQLLGVLVGLLAVGMLLVPRMVRRVVSHGGVEGTAVLAVGLAFGFALLADSLGFSVAVGAFVAGILVAESGEGHAVAHAVEPLRAVFASIFFVSIGMTVDPLLTLQTLPLALGIAGLVVVAQLGSVALGSVLSGSPLRRALLAGLALGQIGEFSFILASIGIEGKVVPEALLPTLVTVATLTCFTTPLLLRRGDALVNTVDRRLPDPVLQLLALHQAWMERLRRVAGSRPRLRAAATALVVDWVALLVLAGASVAFRERAVQAVGGWFSLDPDQAGIAVALGPTLVALPLLAGLFRNARATAQMAAKALLSESDPEQAQAPQMVRLFQDLASLVLVLGIGLPSLAVLRPLVPGLWAEPILLVAVVVALVGIRRSMGTMTPGFQSGAEALALRLAEHASSGAERVEDPALLPGFDNALALTLASEHHAVGQTLASLDLRCRSGAMVVAIHKRASEVLLPTGHERLEVGDVLALVGVSEAVDRARKLLETGVTELASDG